MEKTDGGNGVADVARASRPCLSNAGVISGRLVFRSTLLLRASVSPW